MSKGKSYLFNKQTAGKKVKTKNGKTFTLLNPAEKGARACAELKSGKNVYTGEVLTDTQLAFRSGFVAAQQASAAAFRAKNPRYKRKTK